MHIEPVKPQEVLSEPVLHIELINAVIGELKHSDRHSFHIAGQASFRALVA